MANTRNYAIDYDAWGRAHRISDMTEAQARRMLIALISEFTNWKRADKDGYLSTNIMKSHYGEIFVERNGKTLLHICKDKTAHAKDWKTGAFVEMYDWFLLKTHKLPQLYKACAPKFF